MCIRDDRNNAVIGQKGPPKPSGFSIGGLVTYFDPQPEEVPDIFPSPFGNTPSPIALRAIKDLQRYLSSGRLPHQWEKPGNGKMVGVLVVKDATGRIGYLKAFSGTLAGNWATDGFVPPVFDMATWRETSDTDNKQLADIQTEIDAIDNHPNYILATSQLEQLDTDYQQKATALATDHKYRKQQRAQKRITADANQITELAEQSRADKRKKRDLQAIYNKRRMPLLAEVRQWQDPRDVLVETRTKVSRNLLPRLQDCYTFVNTLGETKLLSQLFHPKQAPGGAGDCAAPKLLQYALKTGLKPIALCEFWWGAPPVSGGRHHRTPYPACRGKCGPILPFLLRGIPSKNIPPWEQNFISSDEPKVVFEDSWILIINKPCGLLSVPGRGEHKQDSVLTRLQNRYPWKPWLAHRLDMDTSGLLIVCKTKESYVAFQKLFAQRTIKKRYIAWVEGNIAADSGTIDLPLRVDVDDRPRQIVDLAHGKPAITQWQVLERKETTTQLAMYPHTGRTHQLRVHAAHPKGLAAPIVGDRLYGKKYRREQQLHLHASELSFVHPMTQLQVAITAGSPSPRSPDYSPYCRIIS